MTTKTFILIATTSGIWIASSFAATIPAGTMLAVQTVSSISSNDPVGRTFAAKLDQGRRCKRERSIESWDKGVWKD
jgi:hypothetical protein